MAKTKRRLSEAQAVRLAGIYGGYGPLEDGIAFARERWAQWLAGENDYGPTASGPGSGFRADWIAHLERQESEVRNLLAERRMEARPKVEEGLSQAQLDRDEELRCARMGVDG